MPANQRSQTTGLSGSAARARPGSDHVARPPPPPAHHRAAAGALHGQPPPARRGAPGPSARASPRPPRPITGANGRVLGSTPEERSEGGREARSQLLVGRLLPPGASPLPEGDLRVSNTCPCGADRLLIRRRVTYGPTSGHQLLHERDPERLGDGGVGGPPLPPVDHDVAPILRARGLAHRLSVVAGARSRQRALPADPDISATVDPARTRTPTRRAGRTMHRRWW